MMTDAAFSYTLPVIKHSRVAVFRSLKDSKRTKTRTTPLSRYSCHTELDILIFTHQHSVLLLHFEGIEGRY